MYALVFPTFLKAVMENNPLQFDNFKVSFIQPVRTISLREILGDIRAKNVLNIYYEYCVETTLSDDICKTI